MHVNDTMLQLLEASDHRREQRRQFIRTAASATIAAGGLSLLSACDDDDKGSVTPKPVTDPTPTPTPTSFADADVLNFALNLEYLEAQFYSFAVTGASIPGNLLTGTGTPGAPTGGRQVTFTDPVGRAICPGDRGRRGGACRVPADGAGVGGSRPAGDRHQRGRPFTAAARAAGVVGPTGSFDPYASDENFLLGAFIFEDVGVSAYKGASPLIVNKTYLEAAAGILAAEAYHAGLIRTVLYAKGVATPSSAYRCRADQRCARQPGRIVRPRPGHHRRRDDVQHRADRRQRHRLQPHGGAGAQHRLSQQECSGGRRVLPRGPERQPETSAASG
jgi:hypothetical protein